MKTPGKMSDKQATILKYIQQCAYDYLDSVTSSGSATESRLNAFMAGYCKAMKDAGIDITNEKTLDGVHIVDKMQ